MACAVYQTFIAAAEFLLVFGKKVIDLVITDHVWFKIIFNERTSFQVNKYEKDFLFVIIRQFISILKHNFVMF